MRGILTFIVFILIINGIKAQNCSVNAGVGDTYCLSDSIFLSGSKGGLFSSGTTWNQISGPSVTINTPGILTPQITGFTAGTYKFRISATCRDGSQASDDVTLTVLNSTIANAGADTGLCPSSAVLNGNQPASGETGVWTIRGPNGAAVSIANINAYNSAFTAGYTQGGFTTLRWTINNTNGCSTYDEMVITNFGGTNMVQASAPDTLSGCYTTTTSTTLSGTFSGNGPGGQSGNWSTLSGPNNPFISSPNYYRTTVTGLVQGTYVFVYNVSGPCVTGTDTVTVVVPPPVGTLTPVWATSVFFCDRPTSAVMTGARPIFANDVSRWRQLAGPSALTFTPVDAYVTTVTGLQAKGGNRYTVRYYMENPITGCRDSVMATITYVDTPYIVASSDRVLPCDQDSVNITYRDTGGRTYNHVLMSGPFYGLVRTQYSSMVNFSNMIYPGNYIFRLSRQSGTGAGCVNADDDVRVIVSKTPSFSNAGSDQLLNCETDTTEIAGNIPVVGFGEWSQLSGPSQSKIKDSSDYVTTVRDLLPGQYRYRWLISGGQACSPRQDDVTVFVSDSLPMSVDAGPDRTLCYGGYLFLNGNQPDSNAFGRWRVIPDSGIVITDSSAYNTRVTGLQKSHIYQFIWRVYNGCGGSEDTVQITTDSLLGPKPSIAGINRCLPDTTTRFRLDGNSPWDGTGLWTKIYGPNCTIQDDTVYNSLVTGMVPGHYAFEWTISRGTCDPSRDTVLVTISAQTSAANAGRDIDTCSRNVLLQGVKPAVGQGRWSQIIGSGGNTIVQPDSSRTPVVNMRAGTYVYRFTVTNGACPGSTDDVLVNTAEPASTPIADKGRVWCNPGTINITANRLQYGKGYWTMTGLNPNTPSFSSMDSSGPFVSNLVSGIYHFRWNAIPSSLRCPSLYSDRADTIVLPANAGPDQIFCNVYTTSLTGTIGSKGFWSKYSGGSAVIDTTGNSTAIARNLTSTGSPYKFVYRIDSSYGCPGGSDTLRVDISDTAVKAFAGIDQNYCNKDTFFLNGNNVNPDIGTWTLVSGPAGGSFSNDNLYNSYYLNPPNGTFLFQWTSERGTCSSSDVVLIRNYDSSSIALAGRDTTICPPSLDMNATAANAPASWQQISGPNSAVFSSLINPQATVTGLVKGTYHFTWAVDNGFCPSSKDTVIVYVPYAQPTTANAGRDTLLCNADSMILYGNQPLTGSARWTQLTGQAIVIADDTLYNTPISALSEGYRAMQYRISNGNCHSYDTMNIGVSIAPSVANAGADQEYCLYTNVNLMANTPDTGAGRWTLQRGNGALITLPDSSQTPVTGLNAGTYVFRWTVTNGVCAASIDSVTIRVDSIPTFSDAGPDTVTCLSTIRIAGNKAITGSGTWTLLSGINVPTIMNPYSDTTTITGLDSGTYILRWEIAKGGCKNADTMRIVMPNPQMNDKCRTPYTVGINGGLYYGDMCGAKTFGSEPATHGYAACNTLFYKFRTLPANFRKTLNIRVNSMNSCYNGLRFSLFDSAACPGLGPQFDTTLIIQSPGSYEFDSLDNGKTYILVIDENRNPCTKTLCNLSFALFGSALPIHMLAFDAVPVSPGSADIKWTLINTGEYTGYELWAEDEFSTRLVSRQQHNAGFNMPVNFIVRDVDITRYPVTYVLKSIDRNGQSSYLAQKTIDYFSTGKFFNVYPNPAGNQLNVESLTQGKGKYNYVVTDATGRIISSGDAINKSSILTLDSGNWPSGFYTLIITDSTRTYNFKVSIVH